MKTLKELQAGDSVVRHKTGRSIYKIHRVTETQIVIQDKNYLGVPYDVKFRRETGRKINADTWACDSITVPNSGEVEEVCRENRQKNLAQRINKTSWSNLSLETLEQIAALLPEPKQ